MKKLDDARFNVVVWFFTSISFVLGWLAQAAPFWLIVVLALIPFLGSMWLWWRALELYRIVHKTPLAEEVYAKASKSNPRQRKTM